MLMQASYKNFCVPMEEKQNLKNSKHSLPAPTFGMDTFFFLAKFFISALSKVDDYYVTMYHMDLLDFRKGRWFA